MTGTIFDIKEMAVHDGPGIRTTVFFKGCPLRCEWCHNPEGLSFAPQLMCRENGCLHCGRCFEPCAHDDCRQFGRCLHICPNGLLSVSGRNVTAQQLASELKESAEAYGEGFGGVTFSGGEPLFQPELLFETAKLLNGIHLCIETSGYAKPEVFSHMVGIIDFVIMDIKLADSALHKKHTGVGNELILENFRTLENSGKPFLIRTPLIPEITDTADNLEKIREIIGNAAWEKLPYNEMAGAKYKMLGMNYPLA